jgi:AmmeMemoRadiSam system protein A
MSSKNKEFSKEQGRILLKLARRTICKKLGLKTDKDEDRTLSQGLQDESFNERTGTFVTLHLGGQLRGCIGSLTGSEAVRDGIKDNAVCAAFHDSRFQPLTAEEYGKIVIDISILSPPQPLAYNDSFDLLAKLRPQVDGVTIRMGHKGATFLPQVWEQLPHPEDFLTRLCMKAGLAGDIWRREQLEVETYQVQHFSE